MHSRLALEWRHSEEGRWVLNEGMAWVNTRRDTLVLALAHCTGSTGTELALNWHIGGHCSIVRLVKPILLIFNERQTLDGESTVPTLQRWSSSRMHACIGTYPSLAEVWHLTRSLLQTGRR